MKFKVIIDPIEVIGNRAVFNSFYLQEETTGNCFQSNYNHGNGYLASEVTKDEHNNYVVNGEMKSYPNTLDGLERARWFVNRIV